ncbi:ECF transporter S component [Ornithinibacillus contaminans]|uniref:ECF transporter S component n=1 Tax=Ornithinibacillus contaminans TaxID=694055 RepID=UPI00064E030B|nr:ECF transporter S component [Ornithinibacillus contaminans]
MSVYKVTILALLATLAIVGRLVFNFIPNFQPVTSIIIICGIFLGPTAGIVLAFLVTFLSNMVLGTGIWTIWQIVSWAIIGCLSGIVGKYRPKPPFYVVIILAILSGYLYGFIVSLTNYQITGQGFLAYYLIGLPFDTNHAIGNAVFMVILYPTISYLFDRYRKNHLAYMSSPKK